MTELNFDFKNLSKETLLSYKDNVCTLINNAIDKVVSLTESRTFDNTVYPILYAYTVIDPLVSSFHYASNFYTDKDIRDVGVTCEGEIKKFLIECTMNKDLYNAFLDYHNTFYNEEKSLLNHEQIRYFEHSMRDYRRNGLHLDTDTYNLLKNMKSELSETCTQFSQNLNEENTSFLISRSDLDGLPESWFTNDRLGDINNNNDQLYKVTLKYPDYIPAMEYVKNEQIRKMLYKAYSSRCAENNTPLFEKAVNLRYQIAKLLGYPTHADYKTEVKIVKNAKTAIDFENNLNNLFTSLYNKEIEELTSFANSSECEGYKLNKDRLDMWDITFYSRLYKEYRCNINMEEIKNYFPLDKVRDGMFTIYQTIFNLVFTEIVTDNKWHDDVQLYKVEDKDTGELMGFFFLDMFPRDGKYGHAAAFNFQNGCDMQSLTNNSLKRPHIITMACNFPKNECISFKDVETFFHEFGHVMHLICSKSQISDFSGFGVEWDFVEAPSQMLEYWCYCKEPLQLMSCHKDSGLPISEELINKLIKTKSVLNASLNKRQLMFGIFDLRAHMLNFDENQSFNSRELWYNVTKDILGFDIDKEDQCDPVASFGHLMGGYDAGYYGYLRSESYAANMFYLWFVDNTLNPEIGMRYRKKLLEPGSTKDGIELLRDFLGEDPDDKYFLMDSGLCL